MKDIIRNLGLAMLCCASAAWAQQAPPADPPAARADAAAVPAASPGKPAQSAAPAKPSKATAQSEAGEPRASTGNPQADAVDARSAARPAPPDAAAGAGQKPAQRSAGAADKLQLGAATVTGDREQPKVMYVVPWKRADIGDAQGRPMNSLVDEILSPLDRDVFKREVRYYQTVESGASQSGAPSAAERVEK